MKPGYTKKKTAAKKASKASSGSAVTGRYVTASSKTTSRSTQTTYKPGSLLARSGGMVPTVELSKRAAQNIS